ncbi:MAG TPA: hypothetical protein VJY62_02580 [Bacteroidia bacterium]|nr:hypothetical protein [Bacteroidia bacterium]
MAMQASPYVIKNLSPDVIKNLSPYVIKNLSPYVIKNLSPDVINNLSPYVINNLSPYVINNLSPDVIKNLSPDVINGIKEKLDEWESIPVLDKPYSTILKEVNEKKRCYQQSTFGEITEFNPEENICKSAMCLAGHLVHMAGTKGYELRKKYDWFGAATLIHRKAHPELPPMDFFITSQDLGLAYLEYASAYENTPDETVTE